MGDRPRPAPPRRPGIDDPDRRAAARDIRNARDIGCHLAQMRKQRGITQAEVSNPGCMLQLRAGVRKFGKGQQVMHVVEILDEAYR